MDVNYGVAVYSVKWGNGAARFVVNIVRNEKIVDSSIADFTI